MGESGAAGDHGSSLACVRDCLTISPRGGGLTRGVPLPRGKTRYPVVHDIPSQLAIHPIAAVDEPSHTLYVEVLNQTRQAQTLVVDLRAHTPSGPTATLRQFADGRYD